MSHTYTRSVYIHRPSLLFSCPSLLCIRSFRFSSHAKHSTVKCLCMCNVESRTMQTGKCVCVCAVERFDCIHKRRLYCIHSYVCQVTKQIFRVARLFCTKFVPSIRTVVCVSVNCRSSPFGKHSGHLDAMLFTLPMCTMYSVQHEIYYIGSAAAAAASASKYGRIKRCRAYVHGTVVCICVKRV